MKRELTDEQKELLRIRNILNGNTPPVRYGPMEQATKDKISIANKGKKKPEGFGETVARNNRGRVVSDETRQKMRDSHARRKAEGKTPKPRRKLTDDEKKAISERTKLQWKSLDRRLKHSLAFENKRDD